MGEIEIRAERLKKLQMLKEAGMEAYPAISSRTASISQFLADFEKRLQCAMKSRDTPPFLPLSASEAFSGVLHEFQSPP